MAATSIIQPIDMVKVRIQLRGESGGKTSPIDVAKEIYHQGGVKGFYRGIDSALARQAVYTSLRIGLYYTINDEYMKRNEGKNPRVAFKIVWSLAAGAIAAGIANPFDLALTRMQADQTLPEAERRNYRNVVHALSSINKNEGFLNLYRGCTPTIGRAMSANLSMLVTYDIVKDYLEYKFSKGKATIFASTFVSGIFVAINSLPFDNAKTKLQKQTRGTDGKYMYSGLIDWMKKTAQREGLSGLWTGLPTYYLRVAPHAMFTLMFAEFFKNLFGINK